MRRRLIVLLVLLVVELGCRAQVIIDFEQLAEPGTGIAEHGRTYMEKGFVFGAVHGDWGFASFQTSSPYYTGSTALLNNTVQGITSLSMTNGGYFDLLELSFPVWNPPEPITFTGYRGASLVISNLFDLNTNHATFNGFTNLTEVRWGPDFSAVPFDNVTVSPRSNAPPAMNLKLTGVDCLVRLEAVSLCVGTQYWLQQSTNLVSWNDVFSFVTYSPACQTAAVPLPTPGAVFYKLRSSQ
jgi:hypothetical protein